MRQDLTTVAQVDGDAEFLPGFADLLATREDVAQMTDAQIDLRFPANTGANLKSSNPRLYAVAARLFFEFGFSQREIAVICRVSRQTVAALVEAERPTMSALVQRTARLRRLRAMGEAALGKLDGLLHDDVACRKAGPVAIAAIWRQLEEAADKLEEDVRKDLVVEPDVPKAVGGEALDEATKFLED